MKEMSNEQRKVEILKEMDKLQAEIVALGGIILVKTYAVLKPTYVEAYHYSHDTFHWSHIKQIEDWLNHDVPAKYYDLRLIPRTETTEEGLVLTTPSHRRVIMSGTYLVRDENKDMSYLSNNFFYKKYREVSEDEKN